MLMPKAAVRWCWLLFSGSEQLPVAKANMNWLPFQAYAATAPLKTRSLTFILVNFHLSFLPGYTNEQEYSAFNFLLPTSTHLLSSPQLCLQRKASALFLPRNAFTLDLVSYLYLTDSASHCSGNIFLGRSKEHANSLLGYLSSWSPYTGFFSPFSFFKQGRDRKGIYCVRLTLSTCLFKIKMRSASTCSDLPAPLMHGSNASSMTRKGRPS